ncbi:MAG: hypothetical protein HFH88_14850 [Lachnospiraceae bacterium]|nr:hypothetical protein [Lachnospiraceae bacterium]
MIRIVCDRCGREIPVPGRVGYLAWNFRNGHGGDLIGENVLESRDYCEICMGTIFDFIDGKTGQADIGMETAVPETETEISDETTEAHVPEKAEDKKVDSPGKKRQDQSTGKRGRPAKYGDQEPYMETRGRKGVDIGKILALKKAGWSIPKIADEMSMKEGSVRTAVYRYEKRMEREKEDAVKNGKAAEEAAG